MKKGYFVQKTKMMHIDTPSRNPVLDNAKFLMIFVVVFGHCLEPFIKSIPNFKALYNFIYSFHMPVFIMISGMLSSEVLNSNILKKHIRTLLIPFIVFTVIYESWHYLLFSNTSWYIKELLPHWILWFLSSLFFWRLLHHLVTKIPAFFIISILLSLSIASIPDGIKTFGFLRTFYFWPFFLLGYQFKPILIKFMNSSSKGKVPAWGVVITSLIGFLWFGDFNYKILYGSQTYLDLDQTVLTGTFYRLLTYLISCLICVSVITIIPTKILIPNHWKKNTLYVYLWHGLFINIFKYTKVFDIISTWSTFGLFLTLTILSILLTVTFSTQFVSSFTERFLFQPFHRLIK